MDLRCPVKQGTKVIGLAVLGISLGCSQAVLLTHETEQGGVVTYLVGWRAVSWACLPWLCCWPWPSGGRCHPRIGLATGRSG